MTISYKLENENKSRDRFEEPDLYFAEVDNLFIEIYDINFDSMIQC